MRIKIERFTIGAMLLVMLSLLLQGCGSHNESTPANSIATQQMKQVSGTITVVSSSGVFVPLQNADVSAYKIVNGVKGDQLGKTVSSDVSGYYLISYPSSY